MIRSEDQTQYDGLEPCHQLPVEVEPCSTSTNSKEDIKLNYRDVGKEITISQEFIGKTVVLPVVTEMPSTSKSAQSESANEMETVVDSNRTETESRKVDDPEDDLESLIGKITLQGHDPNDKKKSWRKESKIFKFSTVFNIAYF